jgi:RHS repeat-associated protein
VSYADPLSRLTSSVQYGGEPGGRLGTYTYDNYGRIRLKDGRQYYYGDASRPQRPTAIGAESVGTDDNGEMTVLPGGRGLTYDPQGRLVQVTRAGYYATTYAYDASGSRVVARDIIRGTTTFFFGTFDLYPDEGRIVRHFRAGGDVVASSPKNITMAAVDRAPPATMLAKRVFGGLLVMSLGLVFGIPGAGVRERRGRPRRSLATLLAALLFIADLGCPSLVAAQCSDPRDGAPPTESFFYHVDRLGGPQLITDAMGGVLERIVNRPYGEVGGTYDSSGVLKTQSAGAFGYTGHRLGDSSGLIYMNARFYDPMSGLFVSMDPARAFMSPYSYVGGDPINAKDPTGMMPFLVALLITYVVLIAVSAAVTGIVAAANGASASEALKAAGNAAASSAMNGAIGIVGGLVVGTVAPAIAEAMNAISTGMAAINAFAAGVGHNWQAFAVGVATLAVGMYLSSVLRRDTPEAVGETKADQGSQAPIISDAQRREWMARQLFRASYTETESSAGGQCAANPPIDEAGVREIWRHEGGFKSQVYGDMGGNAGYPTIGYGHKVLPGESFPNGMTESEGEVKFWEDYNRVVAPGLAKIHAPLNQNQVNAISDYLFNVGSAPKMTAALNAGNYAAAAAEFETPITSNGSVVNGLINRRIDEQNLFLSPW